MLDFRGLGLIPDYDTPHDDDLLLRQSTIDSMMLCPTRVGLSVLPGFNPIPSSQMAFGSLSHAGFEHHLLYPDNRRVLYEREWWVKALYGVATKDGYDLDAVASQKLITSMAEEAMLAYELWLSQWWSFKHERLNLIAVEETIYRPLGILPNGRAVWVFGTPDLLHQPGMIDWKTSGRGWSPGKGEVRIQTPTYLWLGERYRRVQPGLGLYVVYDRSRKQWSEWPVPVSQDTIDAALHTLWEYGKAIDAQIFPPTPSAPSGKNGRGWWCSAKYCSAWDICPAKALISDDVDLNEKTPTKW